MVYDSLAAEAAFHVQRVVCSHPISSICAEYITALTRAPAAEAASHVQRVVCSRPISVARAAVDHPVSDRLYCCAVSIQEQRNAVNALPLQPPRLAAPLASFYALVLTQTFSLIGSRMTSGAIGIFIFRETGRTAPLLLISFFNELPGMLACAALAFSLRSVRRLEAELPDYRAGVAGQPPFAPGGPAESFARGRETRYTLSCRTHIHRYIRFCSADGERNV